MALGFLGFRRGEGAGVAPATAEQNLTAEELRAKIAEKRAEQTRLYDKTPADNRQDPQIVAAIQRLQQEAKQYEDRLRRLESNGPLEARREAYRERHLAHLDAKIAQAEELLVGIQADIAQARGAGQGEKARQLELRQHAQQGEITRLNQEKARYAAGDLTGMEKVREGFHIRVAESGAVKAVGELVQKVPLDAPRNLLRRAREKLANVFHRESAAPTQRGRAETGGDTRPIPETPPLSAEEAARPENFFGHAQGEYEARRNALGAIIGELDGEIAQAEEALAAATDENRAALQQRVEDLQAEQKAAAKKQRRLAAFKGQFTRIQNRLAPEGTTKEQIAEQKLYTPEAAAAAIEVVMNKVCSVEIEGFPSPDDDDGESERTRRHLRESFRNRGRAALKRVRDSSRNFWDSRDLRDAAGAVAVTAAARTALGIAGYAAIPVTGGAKFITENRRIGRAENAQAIEQQMQEKMAARLNRDALSALREETGEENDEDEAGRVKQALRLIGKIGRAGVDVFMFADKVAYRVNLGADRKKGRLAKRLEAAVAEGGSDNADAATLLNRLLAANAAELPTESDNRNLKKDLSALQNVVRDLIDLDLIVDIVPENWGGEKARLGNKYRPELVTSEAVHAMREALGTSQEALFTALDALLARQDLPAGIKKQIEDLKAQFTPEYRQKRAKDMWKRMMLGDLFGLTVRGVITASIVDVLRGNDTHVNAPGKSAEGAATDRQWNGGLGARDVQEGRMGGPQDWQAPEATAPKVNPDDLHLRDAVPNPDRVPADMADQNPTIQLSVDDQNNPRLFEPVQNNGVVGPAVDTNQPGWAPTVNETMGYPNAWSYYTDSAQKFLGGEWDKLPANFRENAAANLLTKINSQVEGRWLTQSETKEILRAYKDLYVQGATDSPLFMALEGLRNGQNVTENFKVIQPMLGIGLEQTA